MKPEVKVKASLTGCINPCFKVTGKTCKGSMPGCYVIALKAWQQMTMLDLEMLAEDPSNMAAWIFYINMNVIVMLRMPVLTHLYEKIPIYVLYLPPY